MLLWTMLCWVVACGVGLGLPAAGRAAGSAGAVTPRSTARLVTDLDAYASGQPFRIGLEIVPAAGWHTYWHNPGDAGAAPDYSVAGPGVRVGGIAWPLPRTLADGPTMSFVYAAPVLLARPVIVNGSGPVVLAVEADWLICKTQCVPEHATLSLALPAGRPVAGAERALFEAAARTVPAPAPWAAHISADGAMWLVGVPAADSAMFLPDAPDTTVLSAPQRARWRGDVLTLQLTPTPAFRDDRPMTGVLVLAEGAARTGYRIEAVPGTLPRLAEVPAPLLTLLLAAAGGLLLNLMPCVFPILAMKAVGLAGLGGAARAEVRVHALAYSAGVLLSFLLLAIVLLVLRAAGGAAGWGFQFQLPGFIAAMTWLFFAVGLNLSGVFEVGAGWAGVGQTATMRGGMAGSFATGLLAVLVATPCTAPFMGVAIAAAAGAAPAASVAIFMALGVGFALPWLLLACWPGLAGFMPAPGRWMQVLREALAFPMYAAAVWLLWVASQQTGAAGVLAVGSGLVLIGFAVWLLRLADRADWRRRRWGQLATLVVLFGSLAVLPGLARAPAGGVRESGAMPYTDATLGALRASGRPVLVNMTAAWCITCLVNERVAIGPALADLHARGVAYLVGDWTSQDAGITSFLRAYGREGVPLYVFFAAGAPLDRPGRVLPQILTPALLGGLALEAQAETGTAAALAAAAASAR